MKKVLHITNWYPNEWNTYEGLFVKEQFNVLAEVTEARLINVQVRAGNSLFKIKHRKYNDKEEAYFILTSIKRWKVIEVFSTLLLIYVLFKEKVNKYDLLQIHVAYPLLRFYKWWRNLFNVPILISEHWSAYHFHFNLPVTSKKLDGIMSIFWSKLPVITVSKALQKDIYAFSKNDNFKSYILPNLIDLNTFKYTDKGNEVKPFIKFFIVNVWRRIKNPFPMLEAFSQIAKLNRDVTINIGGYGDLLESMQQFVKDRNLETQVFFGGKLSKEDIADALYEADAYLFSSDYETFSVACAQALCCGVPLLGPNIDAIREYAGKDDGIFLKENSISEWTIAFDKFLLHFQQFNKKEIAKRAAERFSIAKFKVDYLNIIEEVIDTNMK